MEKQIFILKNDLKRINLMIQKQPVYFFIVAILFIFSFSGLLFSAFNSDHKISLNGLWDFQPKDGSPSKIPVPGFYVSSTQVSYSGGSLRFPDDESGPWKIVDGYQDASYRRSFNIPQEMNGKNIYLRFESVNYVTDVYVNDQFAGTHSGGYVPFEINITPFVSAPSANNRLRVEIRYNNNRFLESGTYPKWPTGYYGFAFNLGITGDVSIVARPDVFIDNVHITTSVETSILTVNLEIVNTGQTAHEINVECAVPEAGVIAGASTLSIDPNETITVSFEQTWNNPVLWSPQNPHLYVLESKITSGAAFWQKETKFGFREFKVHGNHLTLNGKNINLRGDNIVIHSESPLFRFFMPDRQSWSAIVDSMLALNMNVIRFHQQPAPSWMLDICDEKGMMVIAESAIYGSHISFFPRSPRFLENAITWTRDWIRRDRNHPSIVIWSAANEIWAVHQKILTIEQLAEIDAAVKSEDSTRPVIYEGSGDLNGISEITSWHYTVAFPGGWPWPRDIYLFLDRYKQGLQNFGMPMDESKPASHGEFEWSNSNLPESDHVKIQAVKVRVQRYFEIDDIRPYRLDWSWLPVPLTMNPYKGWQPVQAEIEFLKNSLNPLLAFDKEYHRNHWKPNIPVFNEGEDIEREIIVFNDCPEGENLELYWSTIINDIITQTHHKSLIIPVGENIQTGVTFKAPYAASDQNFQLQLKTVKNGKVSFTESTVFRTRHTGTYPPEQVKNISISVENTSITLNWDEVEKDEYGTDVEIEHYMIQKSSRADFQDADEIFFTVNSPSYTENLDGIVQNPERHAFYRIYAVNAGGIRSRASDVFAVIDYQLNSTSLTNINEIGLPVHLSGMIHASDFMERHENINGIFKWKNAEQGVIQYISGAPGTDFTLEYGAPIIVNAVNNNTVTFAGKLAEVNYQLLTTPQTSFNAIMLPMNRTDLQNASDVMSNIPDCNGIARWNSMLQGFEQYIPEIETTDFSTSPGHCYYVNVTAASHWPLSAYKGLKSLKTNTIQARTNVSASSVPHIVYGETHFSDAVEFEAFLSHNPSDILISSSPGCSLTESYWIVQCASFLNTWAANDTLKVMFKNSSGTMIGHQQAVLSWNPVDKAETFTSVKEESRSFSFALMPNYPNPFNSETRIEYTISEKSQIQLAIYDIMGRRVYNLTDQALEPGMYSARWNGLSQDGSIMPSGIYLIRLSGGSSSMTRKITLIR